MVFSFSSRQCGSPQHSPRPPALVLEGFSSEERLEPGPGPSDAPAARPPHVPKHVRPCHVGQKVAMMMMPPVGSRTTCLVTPCSQLSSQGPSPPKSRGFSIARDAGGYPDHPMKKGRKNFCLDELELFLVKKLLSGGRLRALSAHNRDRFLPCPSPPDPARVLI